MFPLTVASAADCSNQYQANHMHLVSPGDMARKHVAMVTQGCYARWLDMQCSPAVSQPVYPLSLQQQQPMLVVMNLLHIEVLPRLKVHDVYVEVIVICSR